MSREGVFAAGAYHSLVVTAKHELLAWGGNSYGQLGDGSTTDRLRPVQVLKRTTVDNALDLSALGVVLAVAAGKCHSLAVMEDGEVLAWGLNEDGLLGTGQFPKQLSPGRVIASGVYSVAAGWKHSLALTDQGEVLAWGRNNYGQLGDGTKLDRRIPVKVLSRNVVAIGAGWHHSVALTCNGEVYIWGFTAIDKVGMQGVIVPGLMITAGISAIAVGGVHNLALAENNTLIAWGGNDNGQLGDGSTMQRLAPVVVAHGISRIGAGDYHSLAVSDDGILFAWGFGTPTGTQSGSQAYPTKVEVQGGMHSAVGGGTHSIGLSHRGEIMGWGINSFGQVGDGSRMDCHMPRMVLGSNTVEVMTPDQRLAMVMEATNRLAARANKVSMAHEDDSEPAETVTESVKTNTVPQLLQTMARGETALQRRLREERERKRQEQSKQEEEEANRKKLDAIHRSAEKNPELAKIAISTPMKLRKCEPYVDEGRMMLLKACINDAIAANASLHAGEVVWLKDPALYDVMRDVLRPIILIHGMELRRQPATCCSPGNNLNSKDSPMRLMLTRFQQDPYEWVISDLEDLRLLSHYAQHAPLIGVEWLLTLFGEQGAQAQFPVPYEPDERTQTDDDQGTAAPLPQPAAVVPNLLVGMAAQAKQSGMAARRQMAARLRETG